MSTSETLHLKDTVEWETFLDAPQLGASIRSVHAGRIANLYHAITDPIVQAAAYTCEDTQELLSF